ncbi:hypothetical protein EV286_106331 [Rhizobium sp. BK251]|nr:hypothetical protein EV286_106331 [Rhizobium sp. BK251]
MRNQLPADPDVRMIEAGPRGNTEFIYALGAFDRFGVRPTYTIAVYWVFRGKIDRLKA